MAFIPCVDCADVVLNFLLAGVPMSIVLSAKKGGSITVTNLVNLGKAIIDGIFAFETGAFIPGTNISHSLENIKLTDLTTSTSPTLFQVNGTGGHDLPFPGGDGAASVPLQVANIITWQTASRGRSFRGRSYYPGTAVTQLVSPDSLSTSGATTMIGFWNAVHNAINGAEASTWQHGIISRQTGGAPRVAGLFTPITALRMNTSLATQRRRLTPTG